MQNDRLSPSTLLLSKKLILASLDREIDILKRKLNSIAKDPDSIDDPQELSRYLDRLILDLNIINRGLPPLPQEREYLELDRDEE